MNSKLLAGLAATGLLVGGGGAAAVTTAGSPSAAASTVAVASSTFRMPWAWHGPLAPLVAKGTITKSQAIAIHDGLADYMVSHRQGMHGWCHGGMSAILARGGALETVLGQLVSKGTINNSQASAVTSAFTQWAHAHAHHGVGIGHHGCGWGMMGGSGKGMMQHKP